MNKTGVLKVSNILLFISMVIQVATGVILFFDLFVMRGKLFIFFVSLHKYNGVVFTILMIEHLTLNWGWIKSQLFKRGAA